MTLFDLVGEYKELYQLAIEDGDEQAFLDTLDSLNGELEAKSTGYVHVIKQLEMEEAECDKVIDAFTAKKNIRKNHIKRMKDAVMNAMDVAGLTELPAGEYTIKIQKNGGKQPLIISGEVPDNFKKIIYEDDKDLIRKALADGQKLDFAFLEERGRHLSIK